MDQSEDPHIALVRKLSARVVDSVGFLDALAAECSEHILSAAPLRAQVAFAAAQVIQARVAVHADAVGRLARVSNELDQSWRIAMGGPGGGPTPTKDLLGMAAQAHAEVTKAEEMVLKAARLALDEQKAQDDQRVAPGFTFSGAAETIAVPRDLGAADREALRALMGNLTKYVSARRQASHAIATVGATPVDGKPLPNKPASGQVRPASPPTPPQGDPLAMTATPRMRPRRRRTR